MLLQKTFEPSVIPASATWTTLTQAARLRGRDKKKESTLSNSQTKYNPPRGSSI